MQQAVGLAVAGAGVTDALAQDNQAPTLRITSYNLKLNTDNLEGTAKYGSSGSSSSGKADASNVYKFDLTVPLDKQWDVRLSAKKFDAASDPSSHKYGSGSGSAYVTTKQNMSIDSSVIDFEVGHHLNLGAQDLRVFAGLRYVDLKSDLTKKSSIKYSSGSGTTTFNFRFTQTSKLTAYGIRAGAEGTMPITKSFSASALAAVSAVKGKRENDMETSFSMYSSTYSLPSDKENWYGADVELALNWDPTPQTDGGALVSIGYTWNKTWDLMNTAFGDTKESDLTERGMFVRLAFPL